MSGSPPHRCTRRLPWPCRRRCFPRVMGRVMRARRQPSYGLSAQHRPAAASDRITRNALGLRWLKRFSTRRSLSVSDIRRCASGSLKTIILIFLRIASPASPDSLPPHQTRMRLMRRRSQPWLCPQVVSDGLPETGAVLDAGCTGVSLDAVTCRSAFRGRGREIFLA